MPQADNCSHAAAEEDTTPYAHYPTGTRFRRPDYKFYKTLDDSAEFTRRIQRLPPPPSPPPGPPPPPPRRPVTAHPATGGGRGGRCPHRQPDAPTWREPEPGWRPIYPEPDLSCSPRRRPGTAPVAADRRAAPSTSKLTSPTSTSSAVCPVKATEEQQPAEAPPETAEVAEPPAVAAQPVEAASMGVTPLAVVDFLESCSSLRPPPVQPPQAPQPPQQPPQTPAARFFRPKTAPGRVGSAASAGAGGLQILGHRLQPAERAASAKPAAPRSGGGAGAGVRQLSEAYDRALEVHGWRMELPGDPCGIKRQFIPERKPINVTVPEPSVKPLPPRMRRTNRFTFFHTTAPRVVMSFDIHPNFTSEQYAKAKAALVRQGKWDYRYRDFSFMY